VNASTSREAKDEQGARLEDLLRLLVVETVPPGSVQEASGLTYRQISEWDSRDVLPHHRTGDRGWRRFSGFEVIALCIVKKLRDSTGTPLVSLKPLLQWLLGQARGSIQESLLEKLTEQLRKAAVLIPESPLAALATPEDTTGYTKTARQAAKRFARVAWPLVGLVQDASEGLSMFLVSDLDAFHIFCNQYQLADASRYGIGFFERPSVVVPLNGVLNDALLTLGRQALPIRACDPETGEGAGEWLDAQEAAVVEAIREGNFRTLLLERARGGSIRLEIERTVEDATRHDIPRLLRQEEYQTVVVKVADGRIVRVVQRKSVKTES